MPVPDDLIQRGKAVAQEVANRRPPRHGQVVDLHPDVPGRRLIVTRASDIKPKPLVWWEHGLVLRAAINLLAARECKGKSTIASSWAARETLAGGTVLWIGSEEPREEAIVPRLIAAGAAMEKIIFVDVETDLSTGSMVFPLDLPAIEKKIVEHNVTMMVLDPCKGVMPSGISGNDDIAIRQYLEPIAALASRRDLVLLGLVHFGKRDGDDSGKLILGSVAWSQVARSVLSVAEDPNTGHRIITNTKANYTGVDRSVECRIVGKTITTDEGPTEIGVVEWLGDTDKDARDLLGGTDDADERTAAEHWLQDYLTENGATPSRDIKASAAKEKITEPTLKRAKKKLGVLDRSEGFPRTSTWYLPSTQSTAPVPEPTEPRHEPTEPTEPTEDDQHKQDEPTEPDSQSAHAPVPEPTGEAHCSMCSQLLLHPVSIARGICEKCHLAGKQPPGAPTEHTPGYTDRVQQILARARAHTNGEASA